MTDRVPGIVLAGGQSRRMGQDKALVTLGGLTLVSWTVARLAPQVSALAISRHDGQLAGVDHQVPVLADAGESYDGPLAGILAGLEWVAATEPEASHAVTVPVDAPFLPPDFVVRLLALRDTTGAAACVAASGERRHPTAALWPVVARHAMRDALREENLRRLGSFLERIGAVEAPWPMEPCDPFLNLNTPEDLAAAEAIVLGRRVAGAEQTGSPQPC